MIVRFKSMLLLLTFVTLLAASCGDPKSKPRKMSGANKSSAQKFDPDAAWEKRQLKEFRLYDERVSQNLKSITSLMLRLIRTSEKLEKGTVSFDSAMSAYKKQAAALHVVVQRAKKMDMPSAEIRDAHVDYLAGLNQIELAMADLVGIGSATSESAADRHAKGYEKHLTLCDSKWKLWQYALLQIDDPDYPFLKISRQVGLNYRQLTGT